VVYVSEAALLGVFLATCLGSRFGANFVEEYLPDCASCLGEGDRKLEKLNSNVFDEIVAADFVFDDVQLRITWTTQVDQVCVRNALPAIGGANPALAVKIDPSLSEDFARVLDDSPFKGLLGFGLTSWLILILWWWLP
jgi:hypothetical protein